MKLTIKQKMRLLKLDALPTRIDCDSCKNAHQWLDNRLVARGIDPETGHDPFAGLETER